MQEEKENVISYYNQHVQHKLNDFIKTNPRIEEAWNTLIKHAPKDVNAILEMGCGIGGITHKMNGNWPNAEVTGLDISTLSIQIAEKLFANDKTHFVRGILTPETFEEQFDFIVLMDVYEHISPSDRPTVHAALNKGLKNKGRIFLSVPTPHNLKWSLKNKPETMQPVDEHISFDVISKLASDTGTEVLLYQMKDIWNPCDYLHIVLEKNDDFELPFFTPKPVTFLERAKRILNKSRYKARSIYRRAFVKSKLK